MAHVEQFDLRQIGDATPNQIRIRLDLDHLYQGSDRFPKIFIFIN